MEWFCSLIQDSRDYITEPLFNGIYILINETIGLGFVKFASYFKYQKDEIKK